MTKSNIFRVQIVSLPKGLLRWVHRCKAATMWKTV